MNFASENNKPLFVSRPAKIAAFNAQQTINEALANFSAVKARDTDDFMVKLGAAKKLPKQTLVTVEDSTQAELKELVVARLQLDAAEKFEFLDGSVYSGAEAAQEVKRDTRIGKYFLDLEKETLRIAQNAFLRGELK